MTAPLVYIAAPLGAPTPTLRRWHRERARLLACFAMSRSYIPVWVHEVAEQALGDDTDPAARERGVALAMQALERVDQSDGLLWVLLNDDGSYSDGVRSEVRSWSGRRSVIRLWSEWRVWVARFAHHLLPEWDRLAERPPECIGSKGCAGEVVYNIDAELSQLGEDFVTEWSEF